MLFKKNLKFIKCNYFKYLFIFSLTKMTIVISTQIKNFLINEDIKVFLGD